MNEIRSLTRRQLVNVHTVRGTSVKETLQRTGMPKASFDVLFNDQKESEKDYTKLISNLTFERLVKLLGIDSGFTGFNTGVVLEWKAVWNGRRVDPRWLAAAEACLNELLSKRLVLTEIFEQPVRRMFARKRIGEKMLMVHDVERDIRIVITQATTDMISALEAATGIACARHIEMAKREFEDTREMIRADVIRVVHFDNLVGTVTPTYSWQDVKAAAREFGYRTDDLVEMMHSMAASKSEAVEAPSVEVITAPIVEEADEVVEAGMHRLRVVSG